MSDIEYENPLPQSSLRLIEALEEAFPPRPVKPGASRDDIMYDAGKQSVIDWLIDWRDAEEE